MKRILLALVIAIGAQAAPPTQCPFNIPVITVPPQQVAGFHWSSVIRPMDDPCLAHVAVEPASSASWYVGSQTAFYMTKNSGQTWTKPLAGQVTALHLTMDGSVQLVYVALGKKLFLSRDKGQHWTNIRTFPLGISSILVHKGTLYVGQSGASHADAGGVWVGNLGAGQGAFKPFGAGHTGLIVWTLAGDPNSNAVYAGTEIFDHPQPYKPPFFRTLNQGGLWKNVAGALPWHVIEAGVRPNDGFVYALTESLGLWGSANQGGLWALTKVNSETLGTALRVDPKHPLRLFVGRHKFGNLNGGVYWSNDGGKTLTPIGLNGATTSDIALNGTSTRVYVALYGSGLYVSAVP